jgi:hypothetical protein
MMGFTNIQNEYSFSISISSSDIIVQKEHLEIETYLFIFNNLSYVREAHNIL